MELLSKNRAYGLLVWCLLAVTVAEGTFLETYQQQLTDLHQELASELSTRFRENSELNGLMIEQDLLPVLAEGAVSIRESSEELREKILEIRPAESSGDCWDAVHELFALYRLFSQWDLQDCAYDGYSRWMREDGRTRFYPVAHELHRASSEVINAIVGVLAEDNAVSNAEEVEGRLDASLDHFNEVSIEGLQDLDEEREQHNVRQAAIQEFMRECIDRTVEKSREDVEYTVRYAQYFCVEGGNK